MCPPPLTLEVFIHVHYFVCAVDLYIHVLACFLKPPLWILTRSMYVYDMMSWCLAPCHVPVCLCTLDMWVGRAVQASLLSALDSAKYVHYEGLATLSFPSSIAKKHHSPLSPTHPPLTSSCNACISDAWVPEHERKLTFQVDTYIRTYVHFRASH